MASLAWIFYRVYNRSCYNTAVYEYYCENELRGVLTSGTPMSLLANRCFLLHEEIRMCQLSWSGSVRYVAVFLYRIVQQSSQ